MRQIRVRRSQRISTSQVHLPAPSGRLGRVKALLVSVAVHGMLGAFLLSFDRPTGEVASTAPAIAIEIIAPPTIAPPPPTAPVTDVQGGGSSRTHDAAPAKSRRTIIAQRRTGDLAYASEPQGEPVPLEYIGAISRRELTL